MREPSKHTLRSFSSELELHILAEHTIMQLLKTSANTHDIMLNWLISYKTLRLAGLTSVDSLEQV